MKSTKISDVKIELSRGDISFQPDVDVVVNAANAQLRTGGGVAGAIHRAAGPALTQETRQYAPIEPGEAVISGGHNLPNDHIIHVLGPVYGRDKPSDKLLADCYRNALELADQKELARIAFPAISTGAFGYPAEDAAKVALKTVKEVLPELKNVKLVRFVLWGQDMMEIHEKAMEKIFD